MHNEDYVAPLRVRAQVRLQRLAALARELGLLVVVLWFVSACGAKSDEVPKTSLVQPNELAKLLTSSSKTPVMLHVGFQKLYEQAHIPGSEFIGSTSEAEGRSALRKRVDGLARTTPILIYCGCCPWVRCPNIQPAWQALRAMRFSNVKVLYIEDDFGADWARKGYPVARGRS